MASASGQATVFVVDDDDAVRDALTTSLSTDGFAALAFCSAAQFIAGYRAARPACLVVEIALPEIDDLFCMLAEAGGDLPVILTSRRLRRQRLPEQLLTCVGMLEKPFGHDELMGLVRRALEPAEPGT